MILSGWVAGIVVYFLGLFLAGGPRSAVLNWIGTIICASGIALIVWSLIERGQYS